MHQYKLMKKALRLKQVDDDQKVHWLAYNSFRAQATKKQGSKEVPVYKTFKQFFNYEEELKRAESELSDEKDSPFKDLIEFKRGEARGHE